MLLTQIVAKVLGLVEAVLDNFVTLGPLTADPLLNSCYGPMQTYSVTVLPCGTTLAGQIANLAVQGLNIFNGILPGLMAKG